ncbi:MAG: ABC transporter substrate-binding protein [Betaproteobacteria bacterium]|jgi:putative tryptophan/tyrosine transport system substrate-binding protein|nr:ABC transporter substrate-binding protein [Betaproteobacteria bacterium]
MDRRTACVALAASPWFPPAWAQPRREARVAWVSLDRSAADSPSFDAFKRGMRELGWVERRNLTVDAWWGEGSSSALRDAVPRILERKPDVVVAQGGPVARVMVDADVKLPLVFTFSGDPVIGKLVASFARPGGNRTGVTFFALELVPKRLQIMKEALPRLQRVATLSSPLHAGEQRELEAASRAAKGLGLAHDYHPVTSAAELDAALEAIRRERADAILAYADALVMGFAERIAAFATKHRIPAVSGWAIFAERGNLMTYGPVLVDSYYRLATFADRILKGANPGDIPVEFPTTVELVVNRKAAQAMGIALPPALLARASRTIA